MKFSIGFIFFSMLFLHIVDDYYLQGILAKMKQKKWWVENIENFNKYKHDYIIALVEHAYSWSFMIHIPWVIYSLLYNKTQIIVIVSIIINTIIHCIVDNEKANKFTLNLVQDQLMHIGQIIITCISLNLLLEVI